MGRIKKLLKKYFLKDKSDIYPEFVSIEVAENFHIHWRNTRLELDEKEFKQYVAALRAAHDKWVSLGSPKPDPSADAMTPPTYLYSGTVDSKHGERPNACSMEVQDSPWMPGHPDFVHFHYRSLRVDLSLAEFEVLAAAFVDARGGTR